jgi:radical SAM enzyme (TIGR01210 family)
VKAPGPISAAAPAGPRPGFAAWVRALRPPRQEPDPRRLLGWIWEEERLATGGLQPALTLFLAGAECRFTCVFCDLWRHTSTAATPPGAIPEQIAQGLAAAAPLPPGAAVKLYNASSFFDERAVPEADDETIAEQVAPFSRVTVECHPRLVGARCRRFAARLLGRIEVAMGLETVHPQALSRLGKGMDLAAFDRAATTLADAGIALRVFVLLAPPFVPTAEAVEWALRSVEHARARGAARVTIIPTRGGNGAMEVLAARGEFSAPTLGQLEAALDGAVATGGATVVTADLWDAAALFADAPCAAERLRRIERINREGLPEPPHRCPDCRCAS